MQYETDFFPTFIPKTMSTEDQQMVELAKWIKKYGGTIVTVLVIFGAFFGGVQYIVKSEVADIRENVVSLGKNIDTIEAGLGKTNERIDGLLKDALERTFPKPNDTKANPKTSLNQADEILRLARSQNIKLNPQLIANFGREVAAISKEPANSRVAWNTLANLLDYRAFLNADLSPTKHEKFVQTSEWDMTAYGFIKGHGPGTITATWSNTFVPANQAFVYQKLEDTHILQHEGHSAVRITGSGTVILDGMRLKNVIFDGITVEYDGGPIAMENIYFVNCKFELKPSSSGQLFAESVLEHVPATFSPA